MSWLKQSKPGYAFTRKIPQCLFTSRGLPSYFLHPFLTVRLPTKVRWTPNYPLSLSLERRCPFLRRGLVTLGELPNGGVRVQARSLAVTRD